MEQKGAKLDEEHEGEHWRALMVARGQLARLVAETENKLRQLDDDSTVWRELQQQAKRNQEKAPARVRIHMGGSLFATSRDTIVRRFPSNLLAVAISSSLWVPADGCFLFHRNPRFFGAVLDYMRDGTIREDVAAKKEDWEDFRSELDFFALPYAYDESSSVVKEAGADHGIDGTPLKNLSVNEERWWEDIKRRFVTLHGYAEREAQNYVAKLEHWRNVESRVAGLAGSAQNMIRVDFGGTVFVTSRETLTKSEWFKAQLSRWKPESEGSYFIDRNPQFFETILDFLRTGSWSIHCLPRCSLPYLMRELDYFCIGGPFSTFEWDVQNILTRGTYTLENGGLTACKSSRPGIPPCVLWIDGVPLP